MRPSHTRGDLTAPPTTAEAFKKSRRLVSFFSMIKGLTGLSIAWNIAGTS